MFVPRIGQRLFLSLALGLILVVAPSVSWATNFTIQAPFVSTTATPASLSVVNSISISNNAAAAPGTVYFGTLDLKNNDIIIHPTAQNETAAYATFKSVYDMIRSGADQGAYDMPGISSSTVSADAGVTGASNAKGGLALGVMLNDDGSAGNPDGSGNPIWGSTAGSDLGPFDGYGNGPGQSLTQYDTIVKYTFIGDLFLEGKVSLNDWSTVFGNLGTHPDNNTPLTQAWQNGDSFYQSSSGTAISLNDWSTTFGLLSLQSQYPYTTTGLAQVGGGAAVPEPASLVTAAIGILGGLVLAEPPA